MKALAKITFFYVMALSLGSVADARGRDKRQGFNFGTSLRIQADDDRTLANPGVNDRDSRSESSIQAINPFVGYAFGDMFNVGLSGTFETSSSQTIDTLAESSTEIRRNTHATLKGAGLFGRFMFARTMFFEAGVGLYDQKTQILTEQFSLGSAGTFSGEREEYEVRAIGPGYNLGGGIEISVARGFHLSTAYMMRMYHLRDYDASSNSLGAKRARNQRREVTFGLSYYND